MSNEQLLTLDEVRAFREIAGLYRDGLIDKLASMLPGGKHEALSVTIKVGNEVLGVASDSVRKEFPENQEAADTVWSLVMAAMGVLSVPYKEEFK